MSQEKVARYKEEKANRKTMMKKEKRKHFFQKMCSRCCGNWFDWMDWGILHTICMKAADHVRWQRWIIVRSTLILRV